MDAYPPTDKPLDFEALLARENALGSNSKAIWFGNWSRVMIGVQVDNIFDEVNLDPSTLDRLQEQAERYPSEPLSPDGTQIRLLHILPGGWDDQVQCKLEISDLHSRAQFEALSYTWGASHFERTIKLEGVEDFPVTDNAWSALRRLRLKDRPRILWVDALCINQGSFAERNQQVAIMDQIYRCSHQCLVWLGEVPNPTADAVPAKGHRLRQADDDDFRALKALEDIFWYARPPWWERAWVMQEVVLAPKVTVYFGPVQVSWEAFCTDFLRFRPAGGVLENTRYEGPGRSSAEFPVHKSLQRGFERFCALRHSICEDGVPL